MSEDKQDNILDSGGVVLQTHCIASEVEGKQGCQSSDAHTIYEHDPNDDNAEVWYDSSCFSCGQGFTRDQLYGSSAAAEIGVTGGVVTTKKEFVRAEKQVPLEKAISKQMYRIAKLASKGGHHPDSGKFYGPNEYTLRKDEIGYPTKVYRGIKPEYMIFYGWLQKYNQHGQLLHTLYPENRDNGVFPTGFKLRYEPKSWNKIGATGQSSMLAGQIKFMNHANHRDILIVGGEVDMPSAYQMLIEYRKSSEYEPTPVVSPTTGETSAVKQIRANYDFLDQFDNIYVGLDNDEAGVKAATAICEALPKDKVKLVRWTKKDPNSMLQAGMGKQFVSDFYGAKDYLKDGMISSGEADGQVEEELLRPKMDLPEFMKSLQDMMAGGIPLGYIVNWIAETGIGKCLGYDTQVMMFDGTVKSVQNILEGELVMGADGTPRTVLNTTRGVDQMYRVSQVRGEDYVVNSKHILSLTASFELPNNGIDKNQNINISIEDYIQLGNKAKRSLKGYKADLSEMKDTKVSLDPYILGLWLADGTSAEPSVTFSKKDQTLIAAWEDFCRINGYRQSVAPSADRDTSITIRANDGMKGELRRLMVLNNKHIPSEFLLTGRRNRLQLLAGILDGDGHLSPGTGTHEVACLHPKYAQGIVWLARSLGYSVKVVDKWCRCQEFSGRIYKIITISGNLNEVPHKLSRKKAGPRRQIKRNRVTGIEVTAIGEGDYYGFQLDGDHMFCLGDFTVTHNSTLVNEAIRHWVYNSPYKVGILSLELTAAQYMIAMISREVGQKINLIEDPQEAVDFVRQPHVLAARRKLAYTEEGESRFIILDERDGDLDEVKLQCQRLIRKHGCQVIIIDPIQDLFEGVSTDQQNAFIKWMKQTIKEGVTFHNVCHVRKGQSSTDRDGNRILRQLTEDDVHGISSIVKSGGASIFMSRDKYQECEIQKNTTYPKIGKCRWTGRTGNASPWYYDNNKHTMYDRNMFFKEFPELIPVGVDLTFDPFSKTQGSGPGQKDGKFSNKKAKTPAKDGMDNWKPPEDTLNGEM